MNPKQQQKHDKLHSIVGYYEPTRKQSSVRYRKDKIAEDCRLFCFCLACKTEQKYLFNVIDKQVT